MFSGVSVRIHLLCGERAARPRGAAKCKHTVGNDGALCDKRARADYTAASDFRAVENNRAHANQRAVPDLAAMHNRSVTYGDAAADHGRETAVRMDNSAVLNICAGADLNVLDIAAHNGVIPNGRLFPKRHIPQNDRARRDMRRWSDPGCFLFFFQSCPSIIGHAVQRFVVLNPFRRNIQDPVMILVVAHNHRRYSGVVNQACAHGAGAGIFHIASV